MSLRGGFWIEYAIKLYHCVMSGIMPLVLNNEKAIILLYKHLSGGRKPNLKNPVLFSEKMQWYKLYDHNPLMEQCANKYTVRKYIEALGHPELLNQLYGVYSKSSEIDYDKLPNQFVLKCTHGSGMNIIVKDKEKLNRFRTKLILDAWMHQDNYWRSREWVYKKMPRHIIAEKFLQDETGELRDYKFYCFNGKPSFMQLEVGRGTKHNTRNFYDMDWHLLPFGKELPHNPDIKVEKPRLFEEMKRIAAELCKPFQYVRVDLYQVGEKIYFGELTFFPAGGAPDFVPSKYDKIVGDMWEIRSDK